ncbi:MAG: 23S rRNA pseudouridine(1911/1915/1917) synthase RluD [Pseudomonadota bacterium]
MSNKRLLTAEVPQDCAGRRVDQVLADLFSDYSRSRLKQWLTDGQVLVNGAPLRPKDKVWGGERIEVTVIDAPQQEDLPQEIPLNIVYEDEAIIVIDKPAGLVVHPGSGNPDRTLLNALLHHAPELINVPRAGIVHRIDKETSGLLVVARTLEAQTALVEQLQERAFERIYDAVVVGVMTAGGTIDAPIGRHPIDRKRMAVTERGKPAVTHYRVAERFRGHTHIKVRLETGRTHQIRVHMAYRHYPLVGDPVYGGRMKLPAGASEELRQTLRNFRRQALHARELGLAHPGSGEIMHWESPLPEDMQTLLAVLRQDAAEMERP